MEHTNTVVLPRATPRLQHWLRRLFSFPALLATSLVAVSFIGARSKLDDPDMWWHIRVGKEILATSSWPATDPYSLTAGGTRWIAYEWLGEVLIAAVVPLGGLQALLALQVLLAATFMVLLYYYAYLRCGNVKAAVLACALVLPIASSFFRLRPQLLGYIFLLTTLICLEMFRQGRNSALWALPGIFLLWVNTHGTFVFGLLALGLYWASGLVRFQWGGIEGTAWSPSQRKFILFITLLCMFALTITPYGTQIAAAPLELAFSMPVAVANVMEWQPVGYSGPGLKMFLGLLLPFLLAQMALRPNYRPDELALFLFATYSACMHLRFFMLFTVAFAPLAAMLLVRWMDPYDERKDRHALNAALMIVMALALIRYFPAHRELEAHVASKYPQGAVQYLKQHPVAGPVLNTYGWGGYLIWAMPPAHKVFIDGRADIYEYTGVLSDYLRIERLDPDTLPLLNKYAVEACLIERDKPLATLLAALPNWTQVYKDDVSVLYVRKNGLSRPHAVVAGNASLVKDAALSVP